MKITAGKRDEMLKRRAEHQAKWDEYNKDHEERSSRYYQAQRNVFAPIKEKLEKDLAQFDLLDFDISVDRGWSWNRDTNSEYEFAQVRIRCNENRKFDEDGSALSWSYDVGVGKDGEVSRETSSWSGLKACTANQIASLKQTVAALELLNSYDWKTTIQVTLPEYKEFFDGGVPRPDNINYTSDIRQATIEDMIGQDALIKINGWGESFTNRYYYAKVLGQTDRQWRLAIVSSYLVDALIKDDFETPEDKERYVKSLSQSLDTSDRWNIVRARKDNIIPIEEDGEPIIVMLSDLGL